jgi:23S rRNA (guanosine2251-2'-O)-methyltransferase
MREALYGRRPVLEALRSNTRVYRVLVADSAKVRGALADILTIAEAQGIPVERVPRHELDQMSLRHQGVVAEVEGYRYATVDDCLAQAAQRGEKPLLLVLDAVQDVQNLGSLLRTAEAVGAHGVILPKHRAAGVTSAVRKASAGAVEHLAVTRVTNLVRTLRLLKEQGIWVVGLDMAGSQAYDEVDWDMPVAIVVGSEGRGLSRLVRETCDFLVRLPMRGHVESLNAAVAGSIVLYAAWRGRSVTSTSAPEAVSI